MFLVKGRPFDVKECFLEDILKLTGLKNKDMLKEETWISMKFLSINLLI